MNQLFDLLVVLLQWIAKHTGLSYKAVNIWIFCILEPIIFLVMAYIIWKQRTIIRAGQQTGSTPGL